MSYIKYFNESGKLSIGTVSVGVSSSTSMTALTSVLVPANTFTTGDYINIEGMFSKYGVNSTSTIRFYYNTGSTLTGAITVATNGLGVTGGYNLLTRKLFIANNTGGGTGNSIGTQVISSTVSYDSDHIGGGKTNLAIDWRSDVYIISAGLVANASDSIENYGIKLYTY